MHFAENLRQLVDQRNIDVPLDILHDFCCLCRPDIGSPVDPGDEAVQFCHGIRRVLVDTGNNLCRFCKDMLGITWIDAFGRVTDFEILTDLVTGFFSSAGMMYFFGHPGIDRRFKDHDASFLHMGADRFCCTPEIGQVGIEGACQEGCMQIIMKSAFWICAGSEVTVMEAGFFCRFRIFCSSMS